MKALGTLLTAALLIVGAILVFIFLGWYDVAASDPHTPAIRLLFGTVSKNSVRAHAKGIEAPQLTQPMAVAGAAHYKAHCAVCHGAPGQQRGEIGQGLMPRPPDLAETAQDWSPGELYWIVRHGIKMTGMPAWGDSHSDEEIWQTVAFVRLLPRLSAREYDAMAAQAPPHEHAHAHPDEHDGHEH